MPHMFTNRPRRFAFHRDRADVNGQFRWETVNAFAYKLGGLLFVIGSILFFPSMSAYMDVGCWIFFVGSLIYLVVTLHDLVEVHLHWKGVSGLPAEAVCEYAAALSYVVGTVLFVLGSVFFLSEVGWITLAGSSFIIGSLLFVAGASINVVQVVRYRDRLTLQLMNLTAVSFVTGSVLFTVASVPILWDLQTASDDRLVGAFLGWQYLVGSGLFLLGGMFNYWRAYIFVRREEASGPDH